MVMYPERIYYTQGGITLKLDIAKYRAVLFDIDGVLRCGPNVIPGAIETLAYIRQLGLKVGVITNNTGASATSIKEGLDELGLRFHTNEIMSAVTATAVCLSKQTPGGKVYAMTWPEAEEEMRKYGLVTFDRPKDCDYQCDYLVVGGCPLMTREMLTNALRVALAGAKFVAISMDRTYPAKGGLYPGAGAVVGAITGMLGHGPDILIGKPSPIIAQAALENLGVTAKDALMIGDTLDVDIALGAAVGMDTALVLTGNSRASEISLDQAPTFVLESVADIRPKSISVPA